MVLAERLAHAEIRRAVKRRLPALHLVSVLGVVLLFPSNLPARDLSFDDRINAQEAIERVNYSHQIGASKPFEEAVQREVLEKKVRAYLKHTVALQTFWRTLVTAEMLHAEMERMARQTRMPGRLLEVYAALGNDPLLVQECIARPALVDRLSRNFFANDETIQAAARHEAEASRDDLANGRLDVPKLEWDDAPTTRPFGPAAG
jgi:hypothetical protein